jgi:hypothetical protein
MTNIVTSESTNLKKKVVEKKTVKKNTDIASDVKKVVVYYESGAGYLMPNGFKFNKENRMAELDAETAKTLLALDNFRLPSDEEKEMYYNNQEV